MKKKKKKQNKPWSRVLTFYMSYPAAGAIVTIMTGEKVTFSHYTCHCMHNEQVDVLGLRPPCGFFPCQCYDMFWIRNRTK